MYRHERAFYILGCFALLAFVYWASQHISATYAAGAWGFLGVLLVYAAIMFFTGVDENNWLKKLRREEPHYRRSILLW